MRATLSERKIVIILFVMVFITFSLAHEDSKKLDQLYTGVVSPATTSLTSLQNTPVKKAEPLKDLNVAQIPR